MNIKLTQHKKGNIFYLWFTYQNAMKHHIERIWGWDESWQINDFNNNIKAFETDLITVDTEFAGYVQYKENENNIYINMLILEPAFQGQSLGPEVLQKLLSDSGKKEIELKCFKVNDRAFQFYQSQGFKVIADDENFYTLRLKIS